MFQIFGRKLVPGDISTNFREFLRHRVVLGHNVRGRTCQLEPLFSDFCPRTVFKYHSNALGHVRPHLPNTKFYRKLFLSSKMPRTTRVVDQKFEKKMFVRIPYLLQNSIEYSNIFDLNYFLYQHSEITWDQRSFRTAICKTI